MTLVKLELRVRDWYVPNPFTAFVHVTSNRLFKTFEEIFKSQRKMSLIIHYQPHNDFGEVRTVS
jgi:hypothetical protein